MNTPWYILNNIAMQLPKQTAHIFEKLSKGQFICSNASNDEERRWYNVIEEYYEDLTDYFKAINFSLEKGNEYFYFTRTEARADLERKIEAAYRWIDILDFFKTFETTFGAGYRFTPSDILVRVNVDATLKNKLENLKKYSKEDTYKSSIEKIIDMLRKDNFIEKENEINDTYKVLTSFAYLEELILSINIPTEV